MISPVEYQLALITALKEAVAISRDELVIQAARLFGFDRTGPDLKSELERNLEALEVAGMLVADAQMVRQP